MGGEIPLFKCDSFCHFLSELSDNDACDDAGDQKNRGIVDKVQAADCEHGYNKLAYVMGNSACHTDSDQAEICLFYHQSHNSEA